MCLEGDGWWPGLSVRDRQDDRAVSVRDRQGDWAMSVRDRQGDQAVSVRDRQGDRAVCEGQSDCCQGTDPHWTTSLAWLKTAQGRSLGRH